ncbi:MAG TPA: 30S ribosomal protein S4 [Acidobacteriota bacterium]|nr:30S ribosomal protein S4 [Acidobacteriota bacterium]
MARYTGPRTRLSRREGMDLFGNTRAGLEKRNYPPGEHGRRPIKLQGYGVQLREKQKVKRIYGVLERQFRNYFKNAARIKGVTGVNLLVLLERRLDNVIYRAGFARTRSQARQFIVHGHIAINGNKNNIPSYQVKEGEIIEIRGESKKLQIIKDAMGGSQGRGLPAWLERDDTALSVKVVSMPDRESIDMDINEQLIVELYSK